MRSFFPGTWCRTLCRSMGLCALLVHSSIFAQSAREMNISALVAELGNIENATVLFFPEGVAFATAPTTETLLAAGCRFTSKDRGFRPKSYVCRLQPILHLSLPFISGLPERKTLIPKMHQWIEDASARCRPGSFRASNVPFPTPALGSEAGYRRTRGTSASGRRIRERECR